MRSRLELPEDLEFFPERIFVYGCELDEVAFGKLGGYGGSIDVRDDPLSASDFDELSRFGSGAIHHRRPFSPMPSTSFLQVRAMRATTPRFAGRQSCSQTRTTLQPACSSRVV